MICRSDDPGFFDPEWDYKQNQKRWREIEIQEQRENNDDSKKSY